MSQVQLLHLEDSSLDAELIRVRLVKDGLGAEVRRVVGRPDYVEALQSGRFALILADYSLPGFDGLEALEIARKLAPDTPFLFVSGAMGEEVAIDSLKLGATDYVLKHRLDRLVPAVRRALSEVLERADRRKAEAALREKERMHRLTLDSVRDYAIFTTDIDGTVTSANAGASVVLGYLEGEMVGRPAAIIYTPEDIAADVPVVELRTARRRGVARDERWHVRKDGTRFWGSGLVTPLLDEGGELRGFTKIVRDMTERKLAEEARIEADRRKDEFLAMLAHELRNPLSAVHNAAQLVLRPEVPADRVEWAKRTILDQVTNLARMVDDLLDVSRITLRKVHLRPEPVDLAAVIARAAESARPALDAGGHRLRLAIDSGPMPTVADPTRLEQVVVNLLTNAAKYSEPGGPIALAAAPEGDRLVFRVRDEGVGIAAEMLPRVFDLFAQDDRSLDRSGGGLGVGLTIAGRLVELHGGSIEALSDGPGRGSEFVVRLPIVAADPPAEVPAQSSPAPTLAKPGARVLVVDDNRPTAIALADLLQLSGYEVASAHDGLEAIDAARRQRPEVVLLDIGLPGMDGYQVAEHLRRDEGLEGATIIAITGYGEEQAIRRSREAGFDHHLVKPVDYDALLGLLARVGDAARV